MVISPTMVPRGRRRLAVTAERVVAGACLVCAGYLIYRWEHFTISRISLHDPFGGITLFPRERTPCDMAQSTPCEAIAPTPVTRAEDKVTVAGASTRGRRITNTLSSECHLPHTHSHALTPPNDTHIRYSLARTTPSASPCTVVLMGYKTSRIANYRQLFDRYTAMPDTVRIR